MRSSDRLEARLAREILEGGPHAPMAARTLLERRDPSTLTAAISLIADYGTVNNDAFGCLADAWETYRHLKYLSWD